MEAVINDYRRVAKGEPFYEIIREAKENGQWICDSYNHNDPSGCSNPDCFKHKDNAKNRLWSPPNERAERANG